MGKKILIVEDDTISAKVLTDYLNSQGFTASVAYDGLDAIKKFEEERPDLMIVDVLLPKKNGFEVCHEVRMLPGGQKIPIILMSAVYKTPKAEVHAKDNLEAQEYMVKPFKLSELFEKVQALVGEK